MKKLIICIVLLLVIAGQLCAQTTAISYQGRLADGGVPANGTYNLTFTLFNTNINGMILGGPVTNTATIVSNGLFITTIDFGKDVFTGANFWLEIAVQTNGNNNFTTLMPRQEITPVPYSIYSANAGTAVTASTATSFMGDGSAVTNLNASQLTTGTVTDGRLSSNVALLNANNIFGEINSFNNLSQFGSGTDTQTNVVINGQYSFMLGNGSWFTAPVPFLRPVQTNESIALDIMPNGTNQTTWIDICSTDYYTNHTTQLANGEHLHLAKDANGDGHIALFALGSGAYRNLHLQDAVNNQYLFFGQNNDIGFYQNLPVMGELPSGAFINTSTNSLSIIPNGNGSKLVIGYIDSSGSKSAVECSNNMAGAFSTLYLMKSGGKVVAGGDLLAMNGIESLATNIVAAVTNFIGTTNTSGYAQVWNISGTSGSIIFYNRSGNGGAIVSGTALWTNNIKTSGTDILVGQNCGITIKSGTAVIGSGRAF